MEEILSLVNNRSSIPFHMTFAGSFDDSNIKFEHTISPYNFSPRTHIAGHPTIYVAKWEITDPTNKRTTSTDITAPYTQFQTVDPQCLAKFIDLLSETDIGENLQIYSALKREKKLDEVTEAIKSIYPDVEAFDIIPYPDGSQTPITVIKNDNTCLPIYAYGDGLQRCFYIIGSIFLYKNGILCIDGVDTGFHFTTQQAFCKLITKYAKDNNVQLFISTHNIEFVDNFIQSFDNPDMDNDIDEIRIITLRTIKSKLRIRTLSANEALYGRFKNRIELR